MLKTPEPSLAPYETSPSFSIPAVPKPPDPSLVTRLANKYGYHPDANVVSVFRHESRKTAFAVVVDDFCIRYHSRDDAEYLLAAMRDL